MYSFQNIKEQWNSIEIRKYLESQTCLGIGNYFIVHESVKKLKGQLKVYNMLSSRRTMKTMFSGLWNTLLSD